MNPSILGSDSVGVGMSLRSKFGGKLAVLAALLTLVLLWTGCGDVFRPVAIPIVQPGGDPQREHHTLVVSSNGSNPGSAVIIDVSGDTNVATFTGNNNGVGRNPVYATSSGVTDFAINRDDNSVSSFVLPAVPGQLNRPNLISLPAPTPADPTITPAVPVFAAVAQANLYVAASGRNSVFLIPSGATAWSLEIPVGNNPTALVATPDGTQLFCLNSGSNNVSVILPANNTVFTTIPVGVNPVWGAASSDSTRVFVVNQGDNTVSVIDTTTETVVNTPLPVGAGPNYIVYDPTLNRAYITSPAGNSLSIIENATATAPMAPSVTTVSTAAAPCNAVSPISVTALVDGTRAYVADQVTNNVCVLVTSNNTFMKAISVGSPPATTIGIVSDPDSTRVHAASSATLPIASISRNNNEVTVTTSGSNPFIAGQTVVIAGVADITYTGSFVIDSVLSPTQFTYSQSGPATSSSGGTATVGYVAIIQTSTDSLVTQGVTAAPCVQFDSCVPPPLTISTVGTPTFITLTP
jgi:YVTN family beta-propeller protein